MLNVCHALLLAAEKGRPGQVYFVTDGAVLDTRDFFTRYVQVRRRCPFCSCSFCTHCRDLVAVLQRSGENREGSLLLAGLGSQVPLPLGASLLPAAQKWDCCTAWLAVGAPLHHVPARRPFS